MVSGEVQFRQLGVTDRKSTCEVVWMIDGDRNSIQVEYNSDDSQWSTLGKISVNSLEFVSKSFNDKDRWVILRYENEGNKFQLVVEGPMSSKGRTFYEIRIEDLSNATTLVDKTRIKDLPELEYAEWM